MLKNISTVINHGLFKLHIAVKQYKFFVEKEVIAKNKIYYDS